MLTGFVKADDKKIENYLISQLLKNNISEKDKLEIKDFLNKQDMKLL